MKDHSQVKRVQKHEFDATRQVANEANRACNRTEFRPGRNQILAPQALVQIADQRANLRVTGVECGQFLRIC